MGMDMETIEQTGGRTADAPASTASGTLQHTHTPKDVGTDTAQTVREAMRTWGKAGGLERGRRLRAGLVAPSGKATMCIATRCGRCGVWCDSVRAAGRHCRVKRGKKVADTVK